MAGLAAGSSIVNPDSKLTDAGVEVVIDRLVMRAKIRNRLADSLELALALSGGRVLVEEIDGPGHALGPGRQDHLGAEQAEQLKRGEELDGHQLRQMIATEVGVPLHDVEMMEGRLAGSDYSLNATQSVDDEGREWIDALEDDSAQAADIVEETHDTAQLRDWLRTGPPRADVTGVACEPLDGQNVVLRNAVLLAASLDNCVHRSSLVLDRALRRRKQVADFGVNPERKTLGILGLDPQGSRMASGSALAAETI